MRRPTAQGMLLLIAIMASSFGLWLSLRIHHVGSGAGERWLIAGVSVAVFLVTTNLVVLSIGLGDFRLSRDADERSVARRDLQASLYRMVGNLLMLTVFVLLASTHFTAIRLFVSRYPLLVYLLLLLALLFIAINDVAELFWRRAFMNRKQRVGWEHPKERGQERHP